MPKDALQSQLSQLHQQLHQVTALSTEEQAALQAVAHDIEALLANPDAASQQHDSLVDSINLAVEQFEVQHPTITLTLRNIMQGLVSMGI